MPHGVCLKVEVDDAFTCPETKVVYAVFRRLLLTDIFMKPFILEGNPESRAENCRKRGILL